MCVRSAGGGSSTLFFSAGPSTQQSVSVFIRKGKGGDWPCLGGRPIAPRPRVAALGLSCLSDHPKKERERRGKRRSRSDSPSCPGLPAFFFLPATSWRLLKSLPLKCGRVFQVKERSNVFLFQKKLMRAGGGD